MGNILTDQDGKADGSFLAEVQPLRKDGILGHAVIVHGETDDLGLGGNKALRATSNAGAFITCANVESNIVPTFPIATAPLLPAPVPNILFPSAPVPTFPPGLGPPVSGDKVFTHL
jgi:hypothetical protein